MSGRMGALNTAGKGMVSFIGFPSAEAIDTVGRVAMMNAVDVLQRQSSFPKIEAIVVEFEVGKNCGRGQPL